MNVLFMNPAAQLGGAERSLLDMLASLRDSRPDWRLTLLVTSDGPLVGAARELGVETFILPLPQQVAQLGDGGVGNGRRSLLMLSLVRVGVPALRYAFELRRTIRRIRPDIVHSNGFKMHLLSALARPPGTVLVWHMHDFVSRRPVMSRLIRRVAHRCQVVVANSRSVALDVTRVCNDRVPVRVMYNGIDLESFTPAGEVLDLDKLAGLPRAEEGTVRVGLVATLGWWKGHDTFLRAVSALPPDHSVRAYVIGGALYETRGSQHSLAALRRRAEELGVADRVGFTGFVENPAAAMRALDIVVHASTEPEAFGLVIIEGMACRRAVVASNAGGATELITHGETGLGHRPGDVGDLARCIELLAGDKSLRDRLAGEGLKAVRARFDRRRLADDLTSVYEEALAGGVAQFPLRNSARRSASRVSRL